MALKFLNKKGWHTGSLRNIENVWKAEQKHDAEQKKLDELRKQIVEERERSEFRLLQEQAGLVPRQERLEFLYDSGLSVGRPGGSDGFKTLEALPKADEPPSSSAAAASSSSKQAVPGALFEEKPQSANDAWRKLHSDPLLMIRQREQDALKRIKNNPVQMAMIRKSVEAKKPTDKAHDKKEHQKRHKRRKHSSSIQASDSENNIAEVDRRKSSHLKMSKDVKHSDSEDESRKRVRQSENHVKHSDSEDESRERARRTEKNPVRHSDSYDESHFRARRSEKNHVKHSEDESRHRASRSEKNPVLHSDSEDESRFRARRSEKYHVKLSEDGSRHRAGRIEKNPVKNSDSEDKSRNRARRNEKNHVKHSDSEDESRYKERRSGKNQVRHSDLEDESRNRARRSENHVKRSDLDDASCNRRRGEKKHVNHSDSEDESQERARQRQRIHSEIARDDGQGVLKGKHENSEQEKYPMKGRNESHYKLRNVAPKLSEEERAARLNEMQMDAELHEEQRWKRLKKADENDALEATQSVKSGGRNFLDAVKTSVYGAERGGSSTVEESVRRRTHYLQGRSEASESNAFRR